MSKVRIQAAVTFAIMAGFFWAYALDPHDQVMKGALIGAFAAAWGYWLGYSHQNQQNEVQRLRDAARAARGHDAQG